MPRVFRDFCVFADVSRQYSVALYEILACLIQNLVLGFSVELFCIATVLAAGFGMRPAMQVTRLQLSAHKHMCNSVHMANKKQDNHNKGTESHIVVQMCVKRLYMDLGMGLTNC